MLNVSDLEVIRGDRISVCLSRLINTIPTFVVKVRR